MATLTPDQSRQARKEFGLSQADVAEATGLKRQYLSEFESDTAQRFTSSQLRKLRTFYEDRLAAARADGEEIELIFGDDPAQSSGSSAKVETVSAQRIIFMVPEGTPATVLQSTLASIMEKDRQLIDILLQEAERDNGLFGSGEYSEDTLQAFRDAFELLATNYLMIRIVSGWPELGLSADSINIGGNTVLARLIETATPHLESAGLLSHPAEEEQEEVEA